MQHLRIGIHGKARSGKDTVAKYLIENHGFIRNAFADPLKRAGQQMFMLTEEQTWSDELKEQVIKYWGLSPREMFQKLGTEGGRNVFGDDLWLRRWDIHFQTFSPVSSYVTPDVRFENEGVFLRERGFTIIHLTSGRTSGLAAQAKKHASEMGIPFLEGQDVHIDNSGSFSDLYAQLDFLMEALRQEAK